MSFLIIRSSLWWAVNWINDKDQELINHVSMKRFTTKKKRKNVWQGESVYRTDEYIEVKFIFFLSSSKLVTHICTICHHHQTRVFLLMARPQVRLYLDPANTDINKNHTLTYLWGRPLHHRQIIRKYIKSVVGSIQTKMADTKYDMDGGDIDMRQSQNSIHERLVNKTTFYGRPIPSRSRPSYATSRAE